jgi:hypothetical protein
MAVRIENGMPVGRPTQLFTQARFGARREWDVTPNGQRFLVVDRGAPTQINVISNWFEELKQKVPTGKK